MSETTNILEQNLLQIWNQRNYVERNKIMKKLYSPECIFYESDNSNGIIGIEAINDYIEALQKNWQPEFSFEIDLPGVINHEVARVSWKLGIPDVSIVAKGTDIAYIENGLIRKLFLFLNR